MSGKGRTIQPAESQVAIQNADLQPFTAAATMAGGQVAQRNDGRAEVIVSALVDPQFDGTSRLAGLVDFLSPTATVFAKGDPVYWDADGDTTLVASGAAADFYIGLAAEAKVSGELSVRVEMNAVRGTTGLFFSRVHTLAHDDTDEPVLISALQNPTGMHVMSFHGVISEAVAGSSEDQLIIHLADEDDNVLSIITTSGTPDAAGDIVIGTRTLCNGAIGEVACVIPADKAAKILIDQATVGTPAGEIDFQIICVPLA